MNILDKIVVRVGMAKREHNEPNSLLRVRLNIQIDASHVHSHTDTLPNCPKLSHCVCGKAHMTRKTVKPTTVMIVDIHEIIFEMKFHM